MRITRPLRFAALAALSFLLAPGYATASETYHTCTGFIDSVPTTVSTQGTWCLRQDLSTAIASGAAINIAANNVSIDCNGFKLGGLAAGPATQTRGILAGAARQNIAVRRCAIRGFAQGIRLEGGAGHLVEDNRLDNNTGFGISVLGERNTVRRNLVFDTGGQRTATAIHGSADMIDNTVDGVFGAHATLSTFANGISISGGYGLEIRGNRVRDLQFNIVDNLGTACAICVGSQDSRVVDNHIAAGAATGAARTFGIASGSTVVACADNVAYGFEQPFYSCDHAAGNLTDTP